MEDNPHDPIWSPEYREMQHLPRLHPAELQALQFPKPIPESPPPQFIVPPPISFAVGVPRPLEDLPPVAQDINLGGDLLLNLIFVSIFWEVWICLYPLSALAGLLTLTNAMPFLRGVLPPSPVIGPGLYAVVLGIAAALIVLWNVSRLEHRLARSNVYRIPRHLARIPMLGIATVVAIEKWRGLPYNPTPAAIRWILRTPANLAIVIGVMIGAHFMWNWRSAREFWHRRLEGARLRKRDT
jgi:hypothetical protein